MRQLLTIATLLALVLVGREAAALSLSRNRTTLEVHGVKGHHLPADMLHLIPQLLTTDADAIFEACGLPKDNLDELRETLRSAPRGALKLDLYSLDSACTPGRSQLPDKSSRVFVAWNTDTSNHVNIDCDIRDVCVTTVLQGSPIFPIPAVAISKAEGLPKPDNAKLAKASTLQALESISAFGSLCPLTPVLAALGLSAENLDGSLGCKPSYDDQTIPLTVGPEATSVLVSGELLRGYGGWNTLLQVEFRPGVVTNMEVRSAINSGFERWKAQGGQPDLPQFGKWEDHGNDYSFWYTLHFSISVDNYGDQKHVRSVIIEYSSDISMRIERPHATGELFMQLALFISFMGTWAHACATSIEVPERLLTIEAPADTPISEAVVASVIAWIDDGLPDIHDRMMPFETTLGVFGCGMLKRDVERLTERINSRTHGTKISLLTTDLRSTPCGYLQPKLSVMVFQHGILPEADAWQQTETECDTRGVCVTETNPMPGHYFRYVPK